MIKYNLKCKNKHEFESWFSDSKEFEKLNLSLSLELEIPVIATNEVFYLNNDMHESHDALICIKNK